MRYDALTRAARTRHLAVLGGFHPAPGDDAPGDCKTLVLLGPDEPGFWPHLTASPEYRDGHPDPVDRWSRRVVNDWAGELGATAVFPFGGPPYLPFYRWALRTGRIHASPVRLLVHDEAGLFVSFRAALALDSHIDLPHPPPSPCDACAGQPCRTACPVDALDGAGYDVPACKTYLHSADGQTCMTQGCAVRRACPVSARFGRLPAQSAYHMQQFREAE
ncbi:ferredoxin [Sulfitobacter sabulilitoris]|uniref:Ferredoxin n=1 Tax=Sulfitobacter sabulilitoris TaxID=2562655 RepID=A0A5S3PDC1_9RHOB|nr:ferredoxin [Sulfitobacter sabulilitoris]TMM49430.1 ferredoxin [Sulfitobacter sabulilitoris]